MKRAFTMIEVLLTTVIFSLAVVFIYEALFVSLDGLNYYTTYLRAAPWMDEKIWVTQDTIRVNGNPAQLLSGEVTLGNKPLHWKLSIPQSGLSAGLYQIDLVLSWKQGRKDYRITRTAFARYEEQ